jgi:hypothetical protein
MNDYEMEHQVRRAVEAEFKGWTINQVEQAWKQRHWTVRISKGSVDATVYHNAGDEFPWSVDGLRAETLSEARARRVARLREHMETLEGTR